MDTINQALTYIIKETLELNLSYMPFIREGGLFVPTPQSFSLGALLTVDLHLPGFREGRKIEGRVIWITPKNALHHVLSGVGIQFVGTGAKAVRTEIESLLDKSMDIGGYSYGIMEAMGKNKK